MSYYIIVRDKKLTDNALISEYPNHEIDINSYRFRKGFPLADWLPEGAAFYMSKDFSKRKTLYDFQGNVLRLLFVSSKCRQVIEEGNCSNIEFLPVTIINHQDKIASSEYYILNSLGSVDCMNREQSEFIPDPLEPETFHSVRKLVLNEDSIPPDLEIFRLSNGPTTYIIKQSLKDRLDAEQYNSAIHR